MPSQRQTGGLKTFVDDGSHNSTLSAEDANRIDDAYARAKIRTAKQRKQKILVVASIIIVAIVVILIFI